MHVKGQLHLKAHFAMLATQEYDSLKTYEFPKAAGTIKPLTASTVTSGVEYLSSKFVMIKSGMGETQKFL